jgi:hypothetical protein
MVMSDTPEPVKVLEEGAQEIARSLGALADSSIRLVETGADVMERELALVIRLAQRVRDQVISADLLAEARKQPVPAKFREDAHAIVDLVADVAAVIVQSSVNFVDGLTSRKPVTGQAQPATT